MTEVIAKDRPTIDAAIKSFISITCARFMAASGTDASHDKVMMGIIPGLAKVSVSSKKDGKSTGSNDTVPGSSTGENTNESNINTHSSIQQQLLELARYILKAVNSYAFPIHDTVAYSMAQKPGILSERKEELLEISVVARLWNALIQSEQKPSRFLGRRALKLAWKNLDIESLFPHIDNEKNNTGNIKCTTETGKNDDVIDDQKQVHKNNQHPSQQHQGIDVRERQLQWLQQFEELLFETMKPLPSDMKIDDDSALLWAPDGGAAELAKRRQRRLDAAEERGSRTSS